MAIYQNYSFSNFLKVQVDTEKFCKVCFEISG